MVKLEKGGDKRKLLFKLKNALKRECSLEQQIQDSVKADIGNLWKDIEYLIGMQEVLSVIVKLFLARHPIQTFSENEKKLFYEDVKNLLGNKDSLLQRTKEAQIREIEQLGVENWFERYEKFLSYLNYMISEKERGVDRREFLGMGTGGFLGLIGLRTRPLTKTIEMISSAIGSTNPTVLIISGHTQKGGGATSYSRIGEYVFNDWVVRNFIQKKYQINDVSYRVIEATKNIGLKERVDYANRINLNLYIEVHHDSAQPEDIEKAKKAGNDSALWDQLSGFSIHYSEENKYPEKSKNFSRILAKNMINSNFKPNLYHADVEDMECIDRSMGIYNRVSPHGLYVLRKIECPSIIIECGFIINPKEEKRLMTPKTQRNIVNAINLSLKGYLSPIKKIKKSSEPSEDVFRA
ncbi:N-acetylmuramoyl-L-alanine amidase [Nanoarchaeota archaeon]